MLGEADDPTHWQAPRLVLLLLAGLSTVAGGADPSFDDFRSCREILNTQERVACYDKTVDRYSSPGESGSAEPVDPAVAAGSPAEVSAESIANADGLGANHIKRNKPAKKKDPYEYQLTAMKKDPLGRWQFFFENGQIWRQAEVGFVNRAELPQTAYLSEGVFGRFVLKIGDTRNRIKVKRLK